ncbi:MAG: hypothetical protein IKW45_05290 [Clostridia bacterium]|nr:hypothetical protein [Clostridia bacterium]
MVEFNRVIDGLLRYTNVHVFSNMNQLQELGARLIIARVIGNPEMLKQNLINNGFIRTFAIMDSNGNVDLEPIMKDLKKEIERKGKVTIDIPVFGEFTFVPNDVDEIYREITGGVL